MSLGSFSNDDGDGNENDKKAIGANIKFARAHHAFCTFPCRYCTTTKHNFTLYGGRKQATTKFQCCGIHQPGLMGLLSSQNLGLIKVVTTAKAEREETTPDDSSQTTKTSQELKAEVFHKCAQVFTGLGRLEKPYHIEIDRVSPLMSGCQ